MDFFMIYTRKNLQGIYGLRIFSCHSEFHLYLRARVKKDLLTLHC